MADLDFLGVYPCGNATITVLLPGGTVSRISRLDPSVIETKCPLLFYALDDGPYGDQQASIEATSIELVNSFLRFLYTANYLTCGEEERRSNSLLRHAEIYKMARDFDVPELEVLAHVNFLRETEMSCCIPSPPMDLCDAIRFVYKHLPNQQPLLDTLHNYCVSSFKYHGLDANESFRQVAFDIPEFHRALCQTSFHREFADDGATEIVRLPVCRSNPRSVVLDYADLHVEQRSQAEFQFQEWYDSETQLSETDSDLTVGSPKINAAKLITRENRFDMPSIVPDAVDSLEADLHANARSRRRRDTIVDSDFTLVHRPKDAKAVDFFSESEQSSDEDGFTVVHRSKPDLTKAGTSRVGSALLTMEAAPGGVTDRNATDHAVATFKDFDDEGEWDWSLV